MGIILPYDENLEQNGGFIKPNNEIIYTPFGHGEFASDYCYGTSYDMLNDFKYRYECGQLYDPEEAGEFFNRYNINNINELDIYCTSKLTKEELRQYKLWLSTMDVRYLASDFLVNVLGFGKVETVMRRTIETTDSQPHLRYYNYYLMDWNFDRRYPMKLNNDTNNFEYIEDKNWMINTTKDREIKDELDKIKQKVLLKDRHHFFK